MPTNYGVVDSKFMIERDKPVTQFKEIYEVNKALKENSYREKEILFLEIDIPHKYYPQYRVYQMDEMVGLLPVYMANKPIVHSFGQFGSLFLYPIYLVEEKLKGKEHVFCISARIGLIESREPITIDNKLLNLNEHEKKKKGIHMIYFSKYNPFEKKNEAFFETLFPSYMYLKHVSGQKVHLRRRWQDATIGKLEEDDEYILVDSEQKTAVAAAAVSKEQEEILKAAAAASKMKKAVEAQEKKTKELIQQATEEQEKKYQLALAETEKKWRRKVEGYKKADELLKKEIESKEKLQRKKDALQNEKEALQKEKEALQKEKEALKAEFEKEVNDAKEELQKEKAELERDVEEEYKKADELIKKGYQSKEKLQKKKSALQIANQLQKVDYEKEIKEVKEKEAALKREKEELEKDFTKQRLEKDDIIRRLEEAALTKDRQDKKAAIRQENEAIQKQEREAIQKKMAKQKEDHDAMKKQNDELIEEAFMLDRLRKEYYRFKIIVTQAETSSKLTDELISKLPGRIQKLKQNMENSSSNPKVMAKKLESLINDETVYNALPLRMAEEYRELQDTIFEIQNYKLRMNDAKVILTRNFLEQSDKLISKLSKFLQILENAIYRASNVKEDTIKEEIEQLKLKLLEITPTSVQGETTAIISGGQNPNEDLPTEPLEKKGLFHLNVPKKQIRIVKSAFESNRSSFLGCLVRAVPTLSEMALRRRIADLVLGHPAIIQSLILLSQKAYSQRQHLYEKIQDIESQIQNNTKELSRSSMTREASKAKYTQIQELRNQKGDAETQLKVLERDSPMSLVKDESSLAEAILHPKFPIIMEMQEFILQDLGYMRFLWDNVRKTWTYRFPSHGAIQEYILMKLAKNKGSFELIEYKGRLIHTFKELPFALAHLVWEQRNPVDNHSFPDEHQADWQHYHQYRENNGLPPGVSPLLTKKEKSQSYESEMLLDRSGLYHPDTVLVYSCRDPLCVSEGRSIYDRIPEDVLPKYVDLLLVPDWRKQLDDSYILDNPFELDGNRWASVEHFLRACPYRKSFPEVYFQFSVDSGSPSSFDLDLARSMQDIYAKLPLNHPGLVGDDSFWTTIAEKERSRALQAKFANNINLKTILLLTKEAKLERLRRNHANRIDRPLMELRRDFRSE